MARLGLSGPKPANPEPPEADPPAERSFTGPTITPWETTQGAPVAHLGPATTDPTPSRGGAVFLKQNGQIYMVSDWETLRRWIAESRVDRHDLVSEGGVRWEPIGSRPDLLPAFVSPEVSTTPESNAAQYPFGGETPFGGDYQTASGWHDDDTEGIPTGLPPLPTDEIVQGLAPTGFDAVDVRRRKMTPTPPPVARRQPPPVQRPAFVPPPPRSQDQPAEMDRVTEPVLIDQQVSPTIAPPALPDTVPPAPLRASPSGPRPQNNLVDTVPPIGGEIISRPNPLVSDHDIDIDYYAPTTDELVLAARPNNTPLLLAGCATLLVLASFLLYFGYTMGPQTTSGPTTTTLPNKPDPQPAPDPRPAPDPQPTEDPQPATDPQPVPDPQPTAVPQPTPQPAVPTPLPGPVPVPGPRPVSPTPRPPSVSGLINRGWKLADSDPAAATAVFERALEAAPTNVDAHYGYGYALMKSGDSAGAKPHLCLAAQKGNTDTRREVGGMLANAGMSCP